MKIVSQNPEITFDDILLLPQFSKFNLDKEKEKISLETRISKKVKLDIPIVSSPMPGVTEDEMAIAIGKKGGIGFIHSFQSFERQLLQIKKVKDKGIKVAATIGEQSNESIDHIERLLDLGTDLICIYTYHSLNSPTINFIKKVRKKFPKAQLSTGPIATKEAVTAFAEIGIDSLNVGIGPGSHCTTRLVTGVGRPQLSAVLECYKEAKKYGIPVISEGGIKYAGDVSKALAFGASAVMIGGLFSGTKESPGEVYIKNGKLYKNSWGMCSKTAMTFGHLNKKAILEKSIFKLKTIVKKKLFLQKYINQQDINNNIFEEGSEGTIGYKGSVNTVIDNLINGTTRSLWYQGASNIDELRKKAKVILISNNTVLENLPRI